MLVGLIFRESAKSKRSVTSWREKAKSAIPTHVGGINISPVTSSVLSSAPPSFVTHLNTGSSNGTSIPDKEKFASFGFGRQGEKAAGLKGYLISKPVESLPRYMPKTTSQ